MNRLGAIAITVLTISGAAYAADKAGEEAYEKSCKGCHGEKGVASPAMAKMMKVTIADLGSPEVQAHSDSELVKVITEGKGKMKPVKTLTGKPEAVVAFLRTLKK
jgi:mono/diheme cytochrome c family protein